jgi:hypothetical protein
MRGAVLIARNNKEIDYIKQAVYSANRIKKYLKIPVSLITDNPQYLKENFKLHNFDQVIEIKNCSNYTNRRYYDSSFSKKTLEFKNVNRSDVFDLTPYHETIVLDTDFLVSNDVLNYCFEQKNDFLIYDSALDLSEQRDTFEFKYISETGPKFYWATAFFFRKTKTNKIFFDLVKHIKEHWIYYRNIYQISNAMFRNDFAFSIAIHILNGHMSGEFAKTMPGTMYYTTDRDLLLSIDNEKLKFLIENENAIGNYFPAKIEKSNVHVMNKYSLGRAIDNDN